MATQPRRRGRPTKLTPEIHAVIITAIEAGTPTRKAAPLARVSRSVIYAWDVASRQPGASTELREFAAAFASARAERSRKSVVREPITDGEGREIGTRITRHLRNGVTEVTEELIRPSRRALRAKAGNGSALEHGPLGELLGLAEVA